MTARGDGVGLLRALSIALEGAPVGALAARLAAAAGALVPALADRCAIHLGDPPAPVATAAAGDAPAEAELHDAAMVVLAQPVGALRLARAEPWDPDAAALAAEAAARIAAAIEHERLTELAESCRAYDGFLATLSHELRSPLSVVIGWIDLLRGEHLDADRQVRAHEIIDRNARIQLRLIEDLLESARIASGNVHLDLGAVPVVDLVLGAVEGLRPQADAASIALTCTADPPFEARGDALRLGQIVHNLVGNALRYTPGGGRIEVAIRRERDTAVLVVADDGSGIEAAFLPHVFERFKQEGRRRRVGARGLGLGLYIVRHLIALHGGTVTAASEGPGRGARFTVVLPIEGPAEPAPDGG